MAARTLGPDFGQKGITRRRLLGGSALVLAGISLGGWFAARFTDGRVEPLLTANWLAPQQQHMLARVADVMLDGVLDSQPQARTEQLHWIVANIDAAVDGLPPVLRQDTCKLLAMLAFAPSRLLLVARWQSWQDGSRQELEALLLTLQDSPSQLRRIVYRVLRDLVSGGFYADRRSWASLGYPGPLIDNRANG